MTPRGWVASGLLAAATVAPALADNGRAPMRVSAQVERSCRVSTDQPQVTVDCGTRPQPVQVTYAGAPPAGRTVVARTDVAPSSAATVTIHF